ncbi:MAG TPA: hypothetical protein VE975_02355 [Actinomycetota bacterium]|nr:hypothetical protein [Actinomycetota bacterium]
MPQRSLCAALLVAALAAAGCGSSGGAGSKSPAEGGRPGSAAHSSYDPEAVEIAVAVHEVVAHESVAVELYAQGDAETAAKHAAHPADEILPSLAEELRAHGGDARRFAAAVRAFDRAVSSAAPKAKVSRAERAVESEAQAAVEAIAGDAAADPGFKASIVSGLLDKAAHEYEESVAGVRIANPPEYQDAYGMVHVAHRVYESFEAEVRSQAPHEADEIEEAFAQLGSAVPAVQPPTRVPGAEEVETAAGLVGHELEEVYGALAADEVDAGETIAEIEEKLEEVRAAYDSGAADRAAELVADTYIEHYEKIEGKVIEQAPEVNEELEPLLGAELRRMILEGAPKKEVAEAIDKAQALLKEAEAALGLE